MLVLSRHKGEVIVMEVGETRIELTVVDIRQNNKVRLGIVAPQDVKIIRSEIEHETWRKK